MQSFNVLDSSQNVCANTILEASAGTGKTFSIENLFVRLILEKDLSVERILVVTFTRPATRDLRIRIRENICRVIEMFEGNITPFDYVNMHSDNAENMIRRLQRALLTFDNASIDTIHGFCSRSLRENLFEGDMPLTTQYDGEQPGKSIYLKIIRDYFRTGLSADIISAAQLEIVKNKYVKNLEADLLKEVQKPNDVAPTRSFSQSFTEFQQALSQINLNGDELLRYHDAYKSNYCDLNKLKMDEWVERFAAFTGTQEDFEFLIREGFKLTVFYDESNLKKRSKPHPELDLIAKVKTSLLPIINEARSREAILARMIHVIREMVDKYMHQEEMWRFDDLLTSMQKSIKNPIFAAALREKYDAVIVDEFQDTDPIQWEIFSTLYATKEWQGHIYIVGDPKQSIYGFRAADIYTYLDAVKQIGSEACRSLDVNFRSHPKLIEELNRFFSVDGQFPLPHIGGQLEYKAVKASAKDDLSLIDDGKGPFHFFVGEDKEKRYSFHRVMSNQFFPYIAQEIGKLRQNMPLRDIAILVRKGREGRELAEYLREKGINVQFQQAADLSQSTAVKGLNDILAAAADPRNLSLARVALASSLLGWTDEQLHNLIPEQALQFFHELHPLPVIPFFQRILEESAPNLLISDEGYEIYKDLVHLMELIIQRQEHSSMSQDALQSYIEELSLLEFEEDESLRRNSVSQEDAVQIMTLHASKGLEFDVVFALGLVTQTQKPSQLVPNRDLNCSEAIVDEEDPRYQLYCDETDAEKMRLLYVALTRAKRRVYVPYIKGDNIPEKKPGTASCMELYASLNPGFVEKFSHEHILIEPATSLSDKYTYELSPPPKLIIPWRERFLSSFSSLVKNKHKTVDNFTPPHDFACDAKSVHTLPAGAETGTFLHELFEHLDFQSRDIESILDAKLAFSPYKPWQSVLLDLIKRIQELPNLQDINPENMYREVDFLYPVEQGLIKGVIDLIFRVDNRYYILDWKSNWLGPDDSHYTEEKLWSAMKLNEYELQASIYAEALQRYLGIIDSRAFEECFGGVYYVFLRGIAAEGTGVLHFFPNISPATIKQA